MMPWFQLITMQILIPHRGSAIFLHLTQNYKPTAGCIAISIKDFLTLAKCIKSSDKIKIG